MSDKDTNEETSDNRKNVGDVSAPERKEAATPAVKELIVLGSYTNLFLCRERDGDRRVVTFSTDKDDGIPGSIITVLPTKETTGKKYPKISGKLISVRYCARDLGLEPIPIKKQDKWSPEDECYGKGEPMYDWFKAIAKRGKRNRYTLLPETPILDPAGLYAATKRYEAECSGESDDDSDMLKKLTMYAQGSHFGRPDTNPINKASGMIQCGQKSAARKILMDVLAKDLKCLDAHALLGEIEVFSNPEKAFLHYDMGVQIGQLSLENIDPDPLIQWIFMENRQFLRCLYGTGICVWMANNLPLVKEIFLKMLSYNPSDNQGVRMMLPFIEKGKNWDDFYQWHLAKGNSFQGSMPMQNFDPRRLGLR